jgi:type IV pilus assembly protein PilQ
MQRPWRWVLFFGGVLVYLFFTIAYADIWESVPTVSSAASPPPTPGTLYHNERKKQKQENLKNIEQVVTRVVHTHKGPPQNLLINNSEQQEQELLLKKEINRRLELFYVDPELVQKKISLKLKVASLKDVIMMINALAGTNVILDGDIDCDVKNIKFQDTALAVVLRFVLNGITPSLALVKQMGVWRITKLTTAQELLKLEALEKLEKEYKSECFTLFYTKWDDQLKTRLEKLWQGITGNTRKHGVYIVFDDASKKIMVRGRDEHIQDFKKFLKEIDICIPQVRIDARVVLASKDFEESLGFKWTGYYDCRSTVRHFDFVGMGSKTEDANSIFSDALGWSLNFLPTPFKVNDHVGGVRIPFLFGNKNLETKRLNLMLNAAENKNKLKTIVKPSLLVNNDEWAEILVGEELPHETRISENVEGSLANVTASYYKDIGTKIKVKPAVVPDNKSVLLDIFVENSSVSVKPPSARITTLPSSQGAGTFNYAIETSRSKNKVLLKSGQTTLIGGLIVNTKESVKSGIPVLQDIPLLGQLFRGSRKVLVDKQLLIFITPTLV